MEAGWEGSMISLGRGVVPRDIETGSLGPVVVDVSGKANAAKDESCFDLLKFDFANFSFAKFFGEFRQYCTCTEAANRKKTPNLTDDERSKLLFLGTALIQN